MRRKRFIITIAAAALAVLAAGANVASAHCDGLDGPVVKAAQKALQTNNVNVILAWVPTESEAELKAVFEQTVSVRKLTPESRAVAERHLFETLVRLHRAGEGAPYTGLKPAGRDLGPAIPAADAAIESGKIAALEALLIDDVREGLRKSFEAVRSTRSYDVNDVAAGRAHVSAYVQYIHYVERVHEAARTSPVGHYSEAASH